MIHNIYFIQLLKHWERTGYVQPISCTKPSPPHFATRQAKIALKGQGEEQLLELEAIAKSLNLCARSVYATWVLCLSETASLSELYYRKPSKSEAAQETVAVLAVGPGTPQQPYFCFPDVNEPFFFHSTGPYC